MEPSVLLSTSGLGLIFLLGMRHGFDPDHIAIIDGLTFRAEQERPRLAPWVGTLFSLGHGGLITVIAVAVSLVSARVSFPPLLERVGDWLPIVLLLIVGTLNLGSLLRTQSHGHTGLLASLMPRLARRSLRPAAIVAVGVIFGLVFDTATQAAAWGYAASSGHGVASALLVGATFTVGMMITDTLDSRLLSGLLRRAHPDDARRFRSGLGWLVVALSYGVAGFGIATRIDPSVELSDTGTLVVGATCVALATIAYAWIALRVRRTASVLERRGR